MVEVKGLTASNKMLVFGGRIVHAHENLSEGQIGEIAADQVSKRGPQELEAAAAAAAAAEEQQLLLERLQERGLRTERSY